MNSTEIKIKNLLSVLSSQLERGTFYKQVETIVSELNTLLSTTISIIAPTDERYHQVKKLNDILHELSLMYTNPQTERNSRIAIIKTMLEESIDAIKALSFEVSYDSNGGTAVDAETVAYGTAAQEPAKPTKSSNVFRGWFTDNTTFLHEHDFETLIYDALVLYAKWLTAVTLSFDVDGGIAVTAQVIGKGETGVEPAVPPTKALNVFRGWFNDAGLTIPFVWTTVITANKTLYAKWLTARTVTFDVDDGYAEPAQVIGDGELAVRPDDEDQVKVGYQFVDWYTDGTFDTLYDFATPVTGNVTIYAKYLEKFFVSYDSNGGSQVAGQMVLDGGLATEPTAPPTKDGFAFAGWYTDNTFATLHDFANDTITADTTLYAKWA